jgi:5-hydroxyisourate hydrolase
MKISCHVLDTSLGRPATGVPLRLERCNNLWHWRVVAEVLTDVDGRAVPFQGSFELCAEPASQRRNSQQHRITFDTEAYFRRMGQPVFYPEVRVCFAITSAQDSYHIPLLLSPFGYSTYRGS